MSFNGAGQFNRIYNWTADAANAIPIMASRMDAEESGFATGLSNCICKDGQTTITADIPFANHKITGLADATATQDALNQRTGDARYAPITYRAYKTAATQRNTTTTLADDPDLIINSIPAGSYTFVLIASFGCTTTGTQGISMSINHTGTVSEAAVTYQYKLASATAFSGSKFISGGPSGQPASVGLNTDFVIYNGSFRTTTLGNFSLQWAQFSSSANNTSILAGSSLVITRIS